MRLAAVVLAASLSSACMPSVRSRCPACTVVDERATRLPQLRDARALVVLVPGAFGFGEEWDPVIAALDRARDVPFYVFEWRGPWAGLAQPAAELAGALQATLDHAPPSVREVVVIAHSAGGIISYYAARRVRVPARLRLRVASVAPPSYLKVLPAHPEEQVNTPLGMAIGMRDDAVAPLPPRVEVTEYVNRDVTDALPQDDVPRILLGREGGHDRSLATVGVPLVRALGRDGGASFASRRAPTP